MKKIRYDPQTGKRIPEDVEYSIKETSSISLGVSSDQQAFADGASLEVVDQVEEESALKHEVDQSNVSTLKHKIEVDQSNVSTLKHKVEIDQPNVSTLKHEIDQPDVSTLKHEIDQSDVSTLKKSPSPFESRHRVPCSPPSLNLTLIRQLLPSLDIDSPLPSMIPSPVSSGMRLPSQSALESSFSTGSQESLSERSNLIKPQSPSLESLYQPISSPKKSRDFVSNELETDVSFQLQKPEDVPLEGEVATNKLESSMEFKTSKSGLETAPESMESPVTGLISRKQMDSPLDSVPVATPERSSPSSTFETSLEPAFVNVTRDAEFQPTVEKIPDSTTHVSLAQDLLPKSPVEALIESTSQSPTSGLMHTNEERMTQPTALSPVTESISTPERVEGHSVSDSKFVRLPSMSMNPSSPTLEQMIPLQMKLPVSPTLAEVSKSQMTSVQPTSPSPLLPDIHDRKALVGDVQSGDTLEEREQTLKVQQSQNTATTNNDVDIVFNANIAQISPSRTPKTPESARVIQKPVDIRSSLMESIRSGLKHKLRSMDQRKLPERKVDSTVLSVAEILSRRIAIDAYSEETNEDDDSDYWAD